MNCDLFIEKLPDMIENEISGQDRQEMFEHMKYCKCCRDEFQLMAKFRQETNSSFIDKNLKYESKKDSIMSKIDKNKYKNTKKKSIYRVALTIMVASIDAIIGLVSFNKNFFYKEDLGVENIDNNEHTPNVWEDFSINSGGKVKKDLSIIQAKKVNNPIISTSSVAKFNEDIRNKINKNGDSVLPLKDTIFKKSKKWVGPPRIEYMNDNIMIATAANYIVAYSFKESAYYSIIDLKSLNVGWYQGSQVYAVKYINDRFITIGTVGEKEADDKPIYVIDLIDENTIELKGFSLNNSKLKYDSNANALIIAKNDFSKVIRLNYKSGEYSDINGSIESSFNYSTFELENNEFIRKSIYNDKKLYPSLKSDDKFISLYKNRLFVQRGDSIYVISKDIEKLLVGNLHGAKLINSCGYDEKIVVEKDNETIIINEDTLEVLKYRGDLKKVIQIKYSQNGIYRAIYSDTVVVEGIDGTSKEFKNMNDHILGTKITNEGKLVYLTLDEEVGVKVNIKSLK